MLKTNSILHYRRQKGLPKHKYPKRPHFVSPVTIWSLLADIRCVGQRDDVLGGIINFKMAQNNKIKTVIKEGEESQPIEILESAIVEIARAFKKVSNTRITRETLVTLIHSSCVNVGKPSIRIVLECLDDLENLFLKPKKK